MSTKHVPRNYKGQRVTRNIKEYCKIEIESYNPVDSFFTYSLNPKLSNAQRPAKEGLNYYTSRNTNPWKYIAKHKITRGDYRLEALVFTSIQKNQFLSVDLDQTNSSESEYDIVETITNPKSFTVNEIVDAGVRIEAFYLKNNRLPNYVNINGVKVYRNELCYLLSKCVYQLGQKNYSNIQAPTLINDEPKPKNTIKRGKIYKAGYLGDAYDSYKFIEANKRIYNYVVTTRGYMTATTQVLQFSRVLEFYKRRKRLPNWVVVWNYTGKKLTSTTTSSEGTKKTFKEITTTKKSILSKNKISTTSLDEKLRRIDLGTFKVTEDKNITINLQGTSDCKFINLYFKKIRKNSGDTHNEGSLTILEAKGNLSGKINEDNLSFKILNNPGTPSSGGFYEELNNSGLIFEYRDQVNCYLKDIDGNLLRVFGGYINDALLSDDLMTINISCSNRGVDGSKKSVLKELLIGGAIASSNLNYKCKDLFDGLKYLAESVELPYILPNLTKIVKDIPSKNGFFYDYTVNSNSRKVKAVNCTAKAEGKNLYVRNGRASKYNTTTTKQTNIVNTVESTVTAPRAVNGSCKHCGYTPKVKSTFKNYCPLCGAKGKLKWNPKGTAEGEWTCGKCGADYCGKCGSDKAHKRRASLTKTSESNSKTTSETTTTEVGIPGQTQTVTLWSSAWNKEKEKIGYNVKNYPVFYLTYGMGAEGVNELTKTWIPRKYDAMGRIVPGTGKWVTQNARGGYNTQNPAKFHLELHFTTYPTTAMNNTNLNNKNWTIVTVEFTDSTNMVNNDRGSSITTQGKINRINPIFAYNTFNKAEINLNEWLDSGNQYLRQVNLKYFHNTEQVLYEDKNITDFKLLLKNIGFREGEAYSPEVITTNGQKINDTLETIKNTLRLESYWNYGDTRSKDSLFFRKTGDNTPSRYELEEGINGNVLGVSNINYNPVSNMVNSVTKVYKVPDGYYGHVDNKDIVSLLRFGEHQQVEVLNDDTGYNYANKLAKMDTAHNFNVGYSYTLKAEGYRNIHIGDYMVCTLLDSKLDDIQPVLSIEWEYNPEKRPMIVSTYGMGEMSEKMRAKTTLKKFRKSLPDKRTVFSGGSAEVVYNGL